MLLSISHEGAGVSDCSINLQGASVLPSVGGFGDGIAVAERSPLSTVFSTSLSLTEFCRLHGMGWYERCHRLSVSSLAFVCLFLFVAGSPIAQVGPELPILRPVPPKCWNYRFESHHTQPG